MQRCGSPAVNRVRLYLSFGARDQSKSGTVPPFFTTRRHGIQTFSFEGGGEEKARVDGVRVPSLLKLHWRAGLEPNV